MDAKAKTRYLLNNMGEKTLKVSLAISRLGMQGIPAKHNDGWWRKPLGSPKKMRRYKTRAFFPYLGAAKNAYPEILTRYISDSTAKTQ